MFKLATYIALGLGVTTASGSALAARSFCCVDDHGVRACGDVLPESCRNKAYSEFNEKGQKIRTQEAPLTEAQQVQRDADLKKKREEDRLALDQRRRDQALLNTYASEADLDNARDRQLAEIDRSTKQVQDKLAAAQKTKDKLAKDAEFYKNKSLPADLKDAMRRNDTDIQTQNAALQNKAKEIEDTKARFEADRQRLKELRSPREDRP